MPDRTSFALLIDSENVSAKYITAIMNELTNRHGQVTYRRIYGDWTNSQMGKWKDALAEHSLTPMQQFANTKGKNATDSFLIIDAMDILYEGKVGGFCIVSSDGDFTRLASRLRDAGMTVVGMGEAKTPRSFRNACTVFTGLELLLDAEEEQAPATASAENELTKRDVSNAIVDIVSEKSARGEEVGLSEVGNRLVSIYPDFDVRAFGYSQLSRFLESFDNLTLERRENVVVVKLRDSAETRSEISSVIRTMVREAGPEGMELGQLGSMLHDQYPHFSPKDFGFSKLSKFIRHVAGVVVATDDEGVAQVYLDE